MSINNQNIEELIALCKNNNQKAQFEVYNRYCKAMYNVAYRIVKDEHFAQDVMQEGFLKAFTKINDYKQEVAFGAWLKRIIINYSIDFYKKNNAFQMEDLNKSLFKIEENDSILSDSIDLNSLKVKQVLDTISGLKDNYRMILTLFYIEGYDQEEICEILNISYANCRTTLSRAKENLRKKIRGDMKKENENDDLGQLFEKFENQWDIHEMNPDHQIDFLNKLNNKPKKKKNFAGWAIAASIAVLLGISLFYKNIAEKPKELKFASKETKRTDSIFSILIENELVKLKEKNSPENEQIINDALKQMKVFDADYEKIIKEVQKNGENKQIIYAMISNLQTRISFLQTVLQRIEENENLKNTSDEKTL